jgi:hypothetical protein
MSTRTLGWRHGVRVRQTAATLLAVLVLVAAAAGVSMLIAHLPAEIVATAAVVAAWYVGMAVALALPFVVVRAVGAVTNRT